MSVINREYGHIFVHVPKTGGSSMEAVSFVGGSGHGDLCRMKHYAPDLFCWGFVRHPVDRLFSAYHSLKRNRNHDTPDVDQAAGFAEWVEYLHAEPALLYRYHHTRPQWEFLQLNLVLGVDFLGRFENLEEDWMAVCDRIGVFEPLPKVNRGVYDRSRCVPDDVRGLIYDLYYWDYNWFDYSF